MANKPELKRAVANSKIKATDWNFNFDSLNNYIENGIADNAINKYEVDREYKKGQWVLIEVDGVSSIYESLVDYNIGTDVNDENFWKYVFNSDTLENIINYVETHGLPSFCANSGNVDENGNASLLNLPTSGQVEVAWQSPVVSSATEYGNITWDRGNLLALVDGSTSLITIDGGDYNLTWEFPEDKTIFISGCDVYFGWANGSSAMPQSTKLYLYDNDELVGEHSLNFSNFAGWKGITFEKTKCNKIVFYVNGADWSGTYSRLGEIRLLGTEIITVSTSTSCYFNVGGSYPKLTATNANGESFKTSYIETLTIDGTETDGTYNTFLTKESKSYILANTIYRQATEPTANENDVWLNTSVEPLTAKKYNGTNWEEFNDVPIGSMTIEGGIIQEVETFGYNFNGYEVNNTPKGKEMVVSWGRQFTDVNAIIESNLSGSTSSTYDLGFTDNKVKIGYFAVYVGAISSGGSGVFLTSDCFNNSNTSSHKTGCVLTNNGFGNASYVCIPFITQITVKTLTVASSQVTFIGYQ